MTDLTDATIRDILAEAKTIAVVGHSNNPARTSYQIAGYLRRAGYKVYPVNPTVETIDGEKSYATVADLPETVDIVDVFRRSEYLPDVVEDAINAGAPVVWTQLGVVDEDAAARATDAGLAVVMNRCIKVDHARLIR
jgi:uncharacterized protein